MVEEVLTVRRDYGLELAYFNDDDLANSPEWLVEFCHYMDEAGMQFCGSIRANSVNHDTLKLLASSGCVFLNIALESARESTQKFLRRGMITNQQVMDACLWAEELGIKVRLQNMIGLPVDDPLGDALETLEFNQRINPADSWASIFQPYVGTDLYNYCIDNGLIDASTIPGTFYDGTVLDIPDAEKINRLQRWWYFAVKHQLPRELVEILLNVPIPDEQNKQINDFRWREAARNLYGL